MTSTFRLHRIVGLGIDPYYPPTTVYVYRCDQTGLYHGVRSEGHQVYSVMPWDQPQGGGTWFAHDNDAGIAYVSSGRSLSHMNRTLRRMQEPRDDY